MVLKSRFESYCEFDSIKQHTTVQYSTVQYSTVQYSTVQHSTVQENTLLVSGSILSKYVSVQTSKRNKILDNSRRNIKYPTSHAKNSSAI